ncbi:MAG: 2-oxopent-4-enoate hydratase [Anaerolineae bacterium]|nr:2-oxopent-4-enoate hydratase [Anaerolineae bacterium]GIK83350.1 MAG: 2-keto-4-pentenoate hydratase [Alphaproteobacteria bacterium]
MRDDEILSLGEGLFEALTQCRTVDPLTERHPDMTIEDAYRVQQRLIELRRDRGGRVIGKKIGVTSQAVMTMLGVDQPDFGILLDDMAYGRGDAIPVERLIQPKAEAEIAFVLKRTLRGPGVTAAEVLAATEGVMPCFEIVDSRIRDWKIRIQDTVADNASCGVFVLGDSLVAPQEFDFHSCGMVMQKNGRIVGLGAGAATMGSPVNAVVWLANTLGRLGVALESGEIVLSGALSGMVDVREGDFLDMRIGGLGSCSVRFA